MIVSATGPAGATPAPQRRRSFQATPQLPTVPKTRPQWKKQGPVRSTGLRKHLGHGLAERRAESPFFLRQVSLMLPTLKGATEHRGKETNWRGEAKGPKHAAVILPTA